MCGFSRLAEIGPFHLGSFVASTSQQQKTENKDEKEAGLADSRFWSLGAAGVGEPWGESTIELPGLHWERVQTAEARYPSLVKLSVTVAYLKSFSFAFSPSFFAPRAPSPPR